MTETLNTLRTAEQAYADSREASNKAWANYSNACELHYASKIDRATLEKAYQNAAALDEQASVMWKAYDNAKAAHLTYLESQEQECDCTPISTCNACAQRAHNSEIEF